MEKILFTSNEIEVECNPEDLTRECVIYRLTFPNGKQYIGQTWRILNIRIKTHIYEAFNKNGLEYDFKKSRAIRKYRKFKVDVLYQGFILNEQEIYFIDYFDTMKNGYNSCKGGDSILGFHHSEEAKKKISEKKLGVNNSTSKAIFMLDKNTCEIIKRFDAIADAARYLFGENLIQKKINSRASNITHCLQRPTCTAFGYKWKYVNEAKKKLFEKNLGVNKPARKAIFMLDVNTREIIKRFDSIADAARYLFGENLTREELHKKTVNITHCLQRPTCTAFGYKWKYA